MAVETAKSVRLAVEHLDVQVAGSALPGESVDSYITRLRDLVRDANAQREAATAAVAAARKDLAATRRRGASPEECIEVMERVSELAREVGKARYRAESFEYFLQDAIFRIAP